MLDTDDVKPPPMTADEVWRRQCHNNTVLEFDAGEAVHLVCAHKRQVIAGMAFLRTGCAHMSEWDVSRFIHQQFAYFAATQRLILEPDGRKRVKVPDFL